MAKMISRVWCPSNDESKKSTAFVSSCKKGSMEEGLRIIVQQLSKADSNVVVKSSLRLIKPIFLLNQTHEGSIDSCFLKSCLLCNKTLRLDKEVYMYRGDQGYCSLECRDKQIYLDDIRELESSTKKILATFKPCRPSDRWETVNFSRQKGQVIFS